MRALAIATAYASADYAASLAEFGRPRELPACGGWLLERAVPGDSRRDAMGCYPLFQCRNWASLTEDLDELEAETGGPVAVSLVADPLGDHTSDLLSKTFPDVARPFKDHYLVDLDEDLDLAASAHHRRCTRRAARHFDVEVCDRPLEHLEDWTRLYRHICKRHRIEGIAAFSRTAFEHQLAQAGILLLRACHAGESVAMQIWLTAGDQAWYHLSASDERGYRWDGAAYALTHQALVALRAAGIRWTNLGGGAGAGDGLARFKAGWATETRQAWFCGRILDHDAYLALAAQQEDGGGWFPAYRSGAGP